MTDAQKVLNALRASCEDRNQNNEWNHVYLDNASAGLGMTATKFRAQLSVLSKQGLYQVVDGWAWGNVKMND